MLQQVQTAGGGCKQRGEVQTAGGGANSGGREEETQERWQRRRDDGPLLMDDFEGGVGRARPQAGKESKKRGRDEMNFNLLVEYSRIHS